MKLETLLYQEENGLALLTVNRPQVMNALNMQVLKDLEQVLQHIEQTPAVRVLILTGSGEKAFVAGADIKEIDTLTAAQAKSFADNGQALFLRLENLRVPVIAAVNGFALGGGTELALACDFIFASSTAKFGLPECTLGIMPGYGGTVRLVRRVGTARAKEVAMSGGFYTATEALQMGFVNRVCEPSELLAQVQDFAKNLAQKAPLALTAIKKSINEGENLEVKEALALEGRLFAQLFETQDQKEGTKAFIEKRKAVFQGK